ncbi:MAG: hypothetical protein ACJ73E_18715 [Mycobacteriales bacterium]
MARWADGTAPLDGLSSDLGYADALSTDVGYADALRAQARADALAVAAGADALAAPVPVPAAAAGADPLTGYPDATLLLRPAAAALAPPVPVPDAGSAPPAAGAVPSPAPRRAAGPVRSGRSTPAPVAGHRRDAVTRSELTIRSRAAASRQPPRPPAPPARGGGGWDSFFSGVDRTGGRRTRSTRQPNPDPRSLRELLDLVRRGMRG